MQLVTAPKPQLSSAPKNIIAERMRQARRQARPKVSQEDLAARIATYGVHIDRLGIGRIETGKRTVLDYELRAIAAALYVSVGWLLNEDEVHSEEPTPMQRNLPRS